LSRTNMDRRTYLEARALRLNDLQWLQWADRLHLFPRVFVFTGVRRQGHGAEIVDFDHFERVLLEIQVISHAPKEKQKFKIE
jgi:hypothetical protein